MKHGEFNKLQYWTKSKIIFFIHILHNSQKILNTVFIKVTGLCSMFSYSTSGDTSSGPVNRVSEVQHYNSWITLVAPHEMHTCYSHTPKGICLQYCGNLPWDSSQQPPASMPTCRVPKLVVLVK